MQTLVVNLYGAPGAGKSTGAAYIFAMLKSKGINAELVTEFAKDLTWSNNLETLKNQGYVFGKQYERITRVIGKVDVIVTDSPLLLSLVYNQSEPEEFSEYVLKTNDRFHRVNYFIDRVKPFQQCGRTQSEDEAKQIEKRILTMLDQSKESYKKMDGDISGYDKIVNDIQKLLNLTDSCVCHKCGKQFDIWDHQNVVRIETQLGYGSVFDGSTIDMRLCCGCTDRLIQSCKVIPILDYT